MIIAPSFFETEGRTEKHYDLFSRLLKDRNNWMFGEEAKEYGIVDHVI